MKRSLAGEDEEPWSILYVFDDDESTNVVCEGYAKAFQYLCDLTTFQSDKVKCHSVSGYANRSGQGGHMWNIVTMEDGILSEEGLPYGVGNYTVTLSLEELEVSTELVITVPSIISPTMYRETK